MFNTLVVLYYRTERSTPPLLLLSLATSPPIPTSLSLSLSLYSHTTQLSLSFSLPNPLVRSINRPSPPSSTSTNNLPRPRGALQYTHSTPTKGQPAAPTQGHIITATPTPT